MENKKGGGQDGEGLEVKPIRQCSLSKHLMITAVPGGMDALRGKCTVVGLGAVETIQATQVRLGTP